MSKTKNQLIEELADMGFEHRDIIEAISINGEAYDSTIE